jgi:hypothetical protein
VQWLRSAHPNATILWRTSVPGHRECNHPLNQYPLTRHQYARSAHRRVVHDGPALYYWHNISELNAIAEEVLMEYRPSSHKNSSWPPSPQAFMSAATISDCLRSPPAFRAASCPSMEYGRAYMLDVNTFDQLRPDGHRPGDCLHQCLPGPVDTWNTLLYNFLLGVAW